VHRRFSLVSRRLTVTLLPIVACRRALAAAAVVARCGPCCVPPGVRASLGALRSGRSPYARADQALARHDPCLTKSLLASLMGTKPLPNAGNPAATAKCSAG
jgi:hypothetical protein